MDELKRVKRRASGSEPKCEMGLGRTGAEHTTFKVKSAVSGNQKSCLTARAHKSTFNVSAQKSGGSADDVRLRNQFEQNYALVTQYLKRIEDQGHKLPEDVTQKGTVYYAQLAAEAGISADAFSLTGRESETSFKVCLRNQIEAAAPRLGTEVRILLQPPGNIPTHISYEVLLARGTTERKRELEGRRGARQQLYNTRTALNRLRKFNNLDLNAPISRELTTEFDTSLRNVIDGINIRNSRKKFQTEIVWWHDFYHRLLKEQCLPENFHDALVYLVDRSGLNLSILAKLVDMQSATLYGWYHWKHMPAAQSLASVSKLESLFRLPSGTLTDKVRKWRLLGKVQLSQLPESVQQSRHLAIQVRQHLPDNFLDKPEDKRREIVEYICNSVLKFNDSYTQRLVQLRPLTYSLRRWPEWLEREFNDLAHFKMADRPSLGMRRNQRWRVTTKEMVRNRLGQFLGALHLAEDAEDVRQRGLGLPQEELSLCLLACPLVVDWYVRFHCEARNIYTEHALVFIRMAVSFLRPGTGWLRQSPAMVSRLRPISYEGKDLISAELITKARTDWDDFCDEAIKYYDHMAKEIRPLIRIGRDPFLRIEGIVDMDDPVDAFEPLVVGMRNSLPNPQTQPTRYHLGIRDIVLVLLIQLTGLRRNTVAQLNYHGDGSGHLKKEGETYVLDVPRHLFKEEDSPYFGPKNSQVDYYMELINIFGFYELLSEYLEKSRPFLLKTYYSGDKEQALFVTASHAKSVRVSPKLIYRIYSSATGRHLVENKCRGTGFPKVGAHGPQCTRHIRGTSIVKNGGSFQDAANANQNTERIAFGHYARWLSKDRNRRVNELLFGKRKKN